MIYFFSFGDSKYKNTLCRIKREAIRSNFFDKVITYTDKDLPKEINEYCTNNPTGYGYWIWKPYLTKKLLDQVKENDIICYCDAGCHINKKGNNRFFEYIKMINESDIGNISFQMERLEKIWTKVDVFNYFNAYNLRDTGQIAATVFMLKKNNHNLFITNLWKEASFNNRDLIDNKPSVIANDIHFKTHRNDQSIFSIIRKQYGTILLPDETWKVSANNQWDENYPLQARRLRQISKFDLLLYLLNMKKLLN